MVIYDPQAKKEIERGNEEQVQVKIEKLFKNVATIHGDVLTTESHLQLGVTHNKTQALIYYLSLKNL